MPEIVPQGKAEAIEATIQSVRTRAQAVWARMEQDVRELERFGCDLIGPELSEREKRQTPDESKPDDDFCSRVLGALGDLRDELDCVMGLQDDGTRAFRRIRKRFFAEVPCQEIRA